MSSKECTKCGVDKPLEDYYNRQKNLDGKNSHCKECEHEEIQKWRQSNKDANAKINRRGYLKSKYGITEQQYEELLERQNGCCAICDRHEREFSRRLAIDHNHITGELRGLLCTYCNHKVVGRHRDGKILRKIADYVEQGTGWYVPKKKKTVKRKLNRK